MLEAIVEGETGNYAIRDADKLFSLAADMQIDTEGRGVMAVAGDVLDVCFSDFGSRRKELSLVSQVPAKRQAIWRKLNMTPRGIDREVTEMMHRTHMGCDNDAASTLIHAARTALSDGWGGSMIGTDLSDVIFGTPSPRMSTASLAVLREAMINVLVHGHNQAAGGIPFGLLQCGMGWCFQKNQNLDAHVALLGKTRTISPQSYPLILPHIRSVSSSPPMMCW